MIHYTTTYLILIVLIVIDEKIDTKYSEKFLIFLYFLINDYDINNGMFLETVRNGGK